MKDLDYRKYYRRDIITMIGGISAICLLIILMLSMLIGFIRSIRGLLFFLGGILLLVSIVAFLIYELNKRMKQSFIKEEIENLIDNDGLKKERLFSRFRRNPPLIHHRLDRFLA